MTTPEQRTEWQTLADAATPGPWYSQENDLIGGFCVMPTDSPPSQVRACTIADFTSAKDSRFIAAAREAMPALLAEVAQLQSEVATLRTALRQTVGHTQSAAPGSTDWEGPDDDMQIED